MISTILMTFDTGEYSRGLLYFVRTFCNIPPSQGDRHECGPCTHASQRPGFPDNPKYTERQSCAALRIFPRVALDSQQSSYAVARHMGTKKCFPNTSLPLEYSASQSLLIRAVDISYWQSSSSKCGIGALVQWSGRTIAQRATRQVIHTFLGKISDVEVSLKTRKSGWFLQSNLIFVFD